jgi:hypothetical protein
LVNDSSLSPRVCDSETSAGVLRVKRCFAAREWVYAFDAVSVDRDPSRSSGRRRCDAAGTELLEVPSRAAMPPALFGGIATVQKCNADRCSKATRPSNVEQRE